MNRTGVIQKALAYNEGIRYLEIGIRRGSNLFKVRCKEKIGVDPDYKLSKKNRLRRVLRLEKSKLFKMYSDDFFRQNPSNILGKGFDVIFVDGLHNYQQSLKDVENGLKYLKPNGVIILHDCNPTSAARATPVLNSFDELLPRIESGEIIGWDGGWNGDVWKTIVHLRSTRKDLSVITIDDDQGLGIILKKKENRTIAIDIEELKMADYRFLESNRDFLLNLQPENALDDFLKS